MKQTDIPIWERYTLTIEEASKYFRIGENKLRRLAEENKNANWLIMNGNRIQIKRKQFEKIIDKLNPIITKYVRAIYDGDKEDIREEYILALWEAVNKIQYVNSDGECLKYLHTSIKNKFHELYRKQKIHRDNEVKNVGELFWDFLESSENQYSYIICVESVHQILNLNSKKEYDIVHKMFIEEMTDVEIADIYKISRQYINCIRRKYKKKLKEKLFE